MTPERKLTELQNEARTLRRKAQGAWIEQATSRAHEIAGEINDVEDRIARKNAAADA